MPRPPETTTRAEPRSGRSDFETFSETNLESPASAASTGAPAPVSSAFSKADGRTVTILSASVAFTVVSALPAYLEARARARENEKRRLASLNLLSSHVGRTNVCASLISITSDTGAESSSAAARGIAFFPRLDAAASTCVKALPLSAAPFTAAQMTAATLSAMGLAHAGESTLTTRVTPAALAAACAADAQPSPVTSTVISPGSCDAAVMVAYVCGRSAPSACSAMTSVDIGRAERSDGRTKR